MKKSASKFFRAAAVPSDLSGPGWQRRFRRLLGLFAAASVGGAAPNETGAIQETEIHPGAVEIEFASGALGRPGRFCVIAPATLQGTPGEWPVLFLLHGRGRTHRSLVDLPAMRAAFGAAPFCTVFPQGEDGWYIDSPVLTSDRYEAHLAELMAVAARVRPLSRRREFRALTGWSMGGYGAVRFAIRHPEEFAVVAGIIGLLDFPRPADLPEGQNYTVPVARFGTEPAAWHAFNPLAAADALRGHAVLIVTAADAFDRTMNEHFHARLRTLGVPHEYLVLPGAHTFDVVQAALPRVIEFVARSFAAPGREP